MADRTPEIIGISLFPIKDPYALVIRHSPITDRRLSLADLGLYVRCLWLFDVSGEIGDVAWFISELNLPERETRDGLMRLVQAGYLEVVYPEAIEARNLGHQAAGIRTALERNGHTLAEDERVIIARFAELIRERAQRAADAAFLFAFNDLPEDLTHPSDGL